MNGPTRSPEEEIAYDEGISSRQWIILLSLAVLVCVAIITMLARA
jgi:hypothetical protein